jgi:putative transposase
MPRRARLVFPGTLHHIIVRGIEKKNIVKDDDDRNSFVKRLGGKDTATVSVIGAPALRE